MELTWFRRPAPDRPGTLNLCYNALDRHVVSGHADEPAVLTTGGATSYAVLLERVATMAGALQALGVGPGSEVRVDLADADDELLILLACTRLGAVFGDVSTPALHVTSDPDTPFDAPIRLWRAPVTKQTGGIVPDVMLAKTDKTVSARQGLPQQAADPDHLDVDWDLAIRAGRQDPAACADVDPASAAYVVDGRVVTVIEAVGDASAPGRFLAALCERRAVELG